MITSTTRILLNTLTQKEYSFSDKEHFVNLIGVRSPNRKSGSYDDMIYAVVMQETGDYKLYAWDATTDPSTSYLKRPINSRGAAILCPGQYPKTWRVDSHNGWCRTLCQRGGHVRVYRDNDRDTTLDMNKAKVQTGSFGINFHWDRNEPSGKSGKNYRSSAGCQVFRYKKDHKQFMKLVDKHREEHGKWFTYTLLREEDLVAPVSLPVQGEDEEENFAESLRRNYKYLFAPVGEDHEEEAKLVETLLNPEPEEEVGVIESSDWAEWVIKKEGRFDLNGYLKVYKLPSGDGGGSYEVAGINNKYHPQKAARLKKLIEQKRPAQAQYEAVEYWTRYTNQVAGWYPGAAVEFFLRDCCCNRGPTGAARILQMAAGAYVDGKIGPATLSKASTYTETDLVLRLLLARQSYERKYANRDETSKFWRGLVNRWVSCAREALKLS